MTLVELMVFAAVGLLVVAAAWSFFRASMRRGDRADKKFEGVQSGLLLSIQLERDLAALYELEGNDPVPDVRTGGAKLSFLRYSDEQVESDWTELEVVPVTYQFRTESGRVLRQVGGEAPEVLPGVFERVNFRVANPEVVEPGKALPEAPAVIYSVTAATREVLEKPPARRRGSERTVLVGGVSREQRARRSAYPFWNPVPYARKVRVRQ